MWGKTYHSQHIYNRHMEASRTSSACREPATGRKEKNSLFSEKPKQESWQPAESWRIKPGKIWGETRWTMTTKRENELGKMRGPEVHWSTKVRAAPILMTDSKCNNSSMCSLNIKTRSRWFKSVSDSIWPRNSACSCVCYRSELEKWFKISQSLHWFIAIQLGNPWLTDQKQRLKRKKIY